MAASSAALNIEIIVYDIMNSFSQACTTFTGQNYGAGDLKRCKKSLYLCIIEAAVACAVSIMLILFFGKSLLALFNSDPRVVEIGYTRLLIIFFCIYIQYVVRKYVWLSAWIWAVAGTCDLNGIWRVRGTIGLDLYGISGTSNLYHDHVSISAQLGNDSGFDLHRINGLSPIKAVSKIIIKIEIREAEYPQV